MAYTRTGTKTFTRLQLLKTQIRIALRRTTNALPEILNKVIDVGLEKKWIVKIIIYAVNSNNLCRGQLTLEIDWDEYNLQLSRGKATISIDDRWIDDTAVEIDEIVNTFNEYVAENSLATRWVIYYPPEITPEETKKRNTKLGLIDAEKIEWASSNVKYVIPELPELRVGCYLAED